jgi:hypothetical protein
MSLRFPEPIGRRLRGSECTVVFAQGHLSASAAPDPPDQSRTCGTIGLRPAFEERLGELDYSSLAIANAFTTLIGPATATAVDRSRTTARPRSRSCSRAIVAYRQQ